MVLVVLQLVVILLPGSFRKSFWKVFRLEMDWLVVGGIRWLTYVVYRLCDACVEDGVLPF